jgi:nitroreductase
MLAEGTPFSPDIPLEVYDGIYRQRQVSLAIKLFELLDIKREDKKKRLEWTQKGYRFFDAPAAIIISTGKKLENTWALFDAGCMAQTICLVALKFGLGTCIEVQGISYTDVIRKHASIDQSQQILMGIAIGYPDETYPANSLVTPREKLDSVSSWIGF